MNQYKAFPFLRDLEEQWEVVLGELNNLLYNEAENDVSYFHPWHEDDLYTGQWDVYGLYSFGDKLDDNCRALSKDHEAGRIHPRHDYGRIFIPGGRNPHQTTCRHK
jgi:hypothetical protein